MKKFFFAALLLASLGAQAKPVAPSTAIQAGQRFLLSTGTTKSVPKLTLKHTYCDVNGNPTIYVFDIDQCGFILMSADDMVEPVLGYSLNGVFDLSRVSPNFASWTSAYSDDIAAVVSREHSLSPEYSLTVANEWTALSDNNTSFYSSKATTDVNPLVTSTWDQGYGYNNLCPVYADGPAGHSYTGCVATAMAQIIRYWGYPTTGFGTSSYNHFRYGRQTAPHDSVVYDYSKMPNSVSYYSPADQQYAVSLLCYHCGVSVNMDYQSVDKTDGSGAHTEDAVESLKHFGYFDARHSYMNDLGTDNWKALVKNELDNGRPILYRGVSGQGGGHAFVCDGYRSSQDKYHFNWGWSGYQDGYYTMSNMNGYSSAQGGVYNIQPSYLAPLRDTLFISADGTGDGSSWEQSSSHLNAAIQARSFYKAGHIFVKEGTYYGDTTSNVALTLSNGIKVYGGFSGTEQGIADRDTANHHTILDGMGQRSLIGGRSFNKSTGLYDFTLQNGRGNNYAAFALTKNVTIQGCIIRNCIADSTGDIVTVADGTLMNCTFANNSADTNHNGTIIYANGGNLRNLLVLNNDAWAIVANAGGKVHNSLITHNKGIGVRAYNNDAQVINCDITYNDGIGLSIASAQEVRNSIIYANTQTVDTNAFDNMTFCALDGDVLFTDNGNIHLDETTPVFWMDMSPRGPHYDNNFADYSWHLKLGSPCIDAGDTITKGLPSTDMEGRNRIINGRIDMGCMERRHNIDIVTADDQLLSVWPNPTTSTINVDGPEDATYQLFDIYGRLQRTWSHCASIASLPIQDLPNGVYILRCKESSVKIIKR